MRSIDLDIDSQMTRLDAEWRQAFEDGMIARAEYQALASTRTAGADVLDVARERLDRAEARKAQIMTKIERLEYKLFGSQS